MPGRLVPAFLVSLACLVPAPAGAQGVPAVQAPPASRPVPDQLELSKLIWSTMLAVDHANRSGNYSVLRDLGAQGFQINNDAARLGQIFAGLRSSRIDLSNSLLVPPTYTEPPRQIQPDVFEVKGLFQLRPTALQFDMYFQWEQGRWKLFGIDIQPVQMVEAMPAAVMPPPPARQQDPVPRRR
ncbi:hypothetical protein [Tsuneonella sp. SYSU-LHT278]|uniref:hypothetical protein n=1 Tax=Tsuneonella sediminis TaxID=3416089 RepID=UPI003F79A1F8